MTDGKRDEWEKEEQRRRRNRKRHKERRGGKEREQHVCACQHQKLSQAPLKQCSRLVGADKLVPFQRTCSSTSPGTHKTFPSRPSEPEFQL